MVSVLHEFPSNSITSSINATVCRPRKLGGASLCGGRLCHRLCVRKGANCKSCKQAFHPGGDRESSKSPSSIAEAKSEGANSPCKGNYQSDMELSQLSEQQNASAWNLAQRKSYQCQHMHETCALLTHPHILQLLYPVSSATCT